VASAEPGTVIVVVEIPKGSRNKYEMDPATGHIALDRMLFTSMQYPADYGFIEGTLGGDGDTLDALVFVGEPTFPGCRIRARPIGLFRMRDEKGPDEKILCVPLRDPMWSNVHDLHDLNENLLNEIEHFFAVYKVLEHKEVSTEGFGDRAEALAIIEDARRAAGEPRSPTDQLGSRS
jgi:inorganic pyrophosphatase